MYIVILEDLQDISDPLASYLKIVGPEYTTLQALNIEEAFEMWARHGDQIVAVIVDGTIKVKGDTIPFVAQFASRCFLIAFSSNEDSNKQLLAAGCRTVLPKFFTHNDLKRVVNEIRDSLVHV